MKFEGRWYWCDLCDQPAISCPECHFGSCSGCGCDACDADFEEASRMIRAGEAPGPEAIPHHDEGELMRKLFSRYGEKR